MRILIVEDEVRLSDALSQILTKNKYTVDVSYDGGSGLDNALTGIYDAIILDIMLPKLNGFEVLKELRKEKIVSPVLLLTARDEVADKVQGLDLGADDYLTKPFSTEELLARLRALLRRQGELITDNTISYGDISLNISTFDLICGEKSLKLGAKEFEMMRLFLKNKNRILTKDELLDKVWGYESDAEFNHVEVYISFLRKKLSHLRSGVTIKTIRNVGYHLETETE